MNRKIKKQQGFALMELLLAMAIAAMGLQVGYGVLTQSWKTVFQMENVFDRSRDSSIVFALMGRDIRCAATVRTDTPFFVGQMTDAAGFGRLDFLRSVRNDDGTLRQMEVGYFVERDPALNTWQLVRRTSDKADSDVLTGGQSTVLMPGLVQFKLTYLDGDHWAPSWGWDEQLNQPFRGRRGLPCAILVELTQKMDGGLEHRETTLFPIMVGLLNRGLLHA